MNWTWDEFNDGNWNHGVFDTRKEAIKDAYGCKEWIKKDLCCDSDPVIYIAQCEDVPLETDLDADRELEYLDEQYCDESGCDYYIYDNVSDDEKKWLEQKLSEVIEEFHKRIGLKPCWFRVTNIERFVLK